MRKEYLIGMLSGFLWALSGIVYQKLYYNYPNLNIFFINLIILLLIEFLSLLGITFFFCKKRNYLPGLNRRNVLAAISGILGGPLAMYCYLISIQFIGVSYSTSITASYPIIVALFSKNKTKEKLLFIGFVLFIIFLNIEIEHDLNIFGLSLASSAALLWAIEITFSSYTMRNNNVSAEEAYFIRQLFSVIFYIILLVIYLFLKKDILNINVKEQIDDIFFIQFISILAISTGLSYFLYYKSLEIFEPIIAMGLNITYNAWSIILLMENILHPKLILIFSLLILYILLLVKREKFK
ncbi:DMT family transporter [Rodentibacter caecimuris]|uniref:EamA domain-containing protein n=1 Tax=Rodentibacter caecimuris TaxID=1796644 RepID=A0ABX3KUU6_9PAST|nr:hypothetical protein BKG89_10575 [Rodentibacter heylii]